MAAGAAATEYYKIYNPQQSAGSMGWSASVTAIHSKEYYQTHAKKSIAFNKRNHAPGNKHCADAYYRQKIQ